MKEYAPIAIIGAGLAGLTAAYRLKQSGHHVEVFEARERLGGRVLTVPLGNSYVEMGGQALEDGGEARAIRSLITEMGLSIEGTSQHMTYSNAIVFGDQIDDISNIVNLAPTVEQGLQEQLRACGKKARNLHELLDLFCAGRDHKLRLFLGRLMRGYEGSEAMDLSISYLSSLSMLLQKYQEWAHMKSRGETVTFSLSHIKGGNSKLIAALGEKLKGHIHTGMPLRKISREASGQIMLHLGEGQRFSAHRIILALPCSTLRDVAIEEGIFPEDQMKGVQTLQYGTNGKVILPVHFPSQPYPAVLSADEFFSWFNHDYSLMILYYGGRAGIFPSTTSADIQSKLNKAFPALKLVYPQASFPAATTPMGMSWVHEEFSKGSYSNVAPGTEHLFQKELIVAGEKIKSVFRPIRNQIFFAGEHTPIDYPATLEGAVASGEQACRLILATSGYTQTTSKFSF